MEIIGFIATMVSFMLSLLDQKIFGRLFGYSIYTTSQNTVFIGRSFMIIGRLCNYSLVKLYWMFVVHMMMFITWFWEIFALLSVFKIDTIPYYEGTLKDLLIDSLSGKPTTFVNIRDHVVHNDLVTVNFLIVFFLVPFVICVWKAFFSITRSLEIPETSSVDGILLGLYFLFSMVYGICLSLSNVLFYSPSLILLFLALTLLYGVTSYSVYQYYYNLILQDCSIIPVRSGIPVVSQNNTVDFSMKLHLRDGTVLDYKDSSFYPILGKDVKKDVLVLVKDDKFLYSKDVHRLEVSSNLTIKKKFLSLRVKIQERSSIVKVYDFD